MRVPLLSTLAVALWFIGAGFLAIGVLIVFLGLIMGLSAEVGIFISANPGEIRTEAMVWITVGIPMSFFAFGVLILANLLRLLLYYEEHLYHIRGYLRDISRNMAAATPSSEKRPELPPEPYNDPNYYDRFSRESNVIYSKKRPPKQD